MNAPSDVARSAARGPLRADADGHYLRALLGVPFSPAQLAIATHPLHPQLVVAGAGSGKTAVMAARVVHLVAHHHFPASAVLGLTFTNKAAAELAGRIRTALATLGADAEDDQPTVSTYHAYAASLVAEHALRIGREPVTSLLSEAGRWQLASAVVRAATGPFVHLDWVTHTVTQYLLELDADLAEHLVDVGAVRACDRALREAVQAAAAAAVMPTVLPAKAVRMVGTAAAQREELLTLVAAYRRRKADLDLVDFGDQVALAAEIARRRPEVGELERTRFAAVLLDEYQDTGVSQRLLLAALYAGGHPVTAVGDPCQSIYGWRGASVGNLLRFFEHFSARRDAGAPTAEAVQYLMTNYRGGGRLLNVANAISADLRAPATRARPYVPVPVLTPEPAKAALGATVAALHHTIVDEAAWVAEQVERALVEEATSPGEVAVLCRRRADFATLHAALTARGLPVEVADLGGLLSMPEVADVVATLEVLAEPTANAALLRLLTGPRWRIGPRDLAALGRQAARLAKESVAGSSPSVGAAPDAATDAQTTQGEVSDAVRQLDPALQAATAAVDRCDVVALSDAVDLLGEPTAYSAQAYRRLTQLAEELTALRRLVAAPIVDAVTEVVRVIGLDVEIAAAPEKLAAARAANLAAFIDHAARFVGIDGEADLAAFLDYLAAAADVEHGLDIGSVSAANTVKLLTVHKAKGLEWDVVAVPGMCTGTFPSSQGRSRWTTSAKVLPYRLRGDRDDLPPDPVLTTAGLRGFAQACRDEDADEERRLAYVAVTRARRRLIASGYRWGQTQVKPKDPAPFLLEIRARCLAGDGTVELWVAEPGATNPLATVAPDMAWPEPYDGTELALRREAATLVRESLAGSAPDDAALLAELDESDQATALRWRAEAGLLLGERAAQQDPRREVPLPRALTTSQIVALREDPDGLARTLARPMPRQPSAAAARGTAFHAWVEALFGARPLIDELPGAVDGELADDAALAGLQEAFARSPYGERTPYAVEAPFELLIGGRVVRGRIDAVYRNEGGYEVMDYKTGLRPRNPAAAALQLAVYRLAWAGIVGVPVACVDAAFLYLRTGELVRPPLPDAEELAALLAGPATSTPR